MRGTSPSHHIRICSNWTVTLAAGMHDFIKKRMQLVIKVIPTFRLYTASLLKAIMLTGFVKHYDPSHSVVIYWSLQLWLRHYAENPQWFATNVVFLDFYSFRNKFLFYCPPILLYPSWFFKMQKMNLAIIRLSWRLLIMWLIQKVI